MQLLVAVFKVDRKFDNDTGRVPLAILRTIATLRSTLVLDVVAEGIETPAHQRAALAAGCTRKQGWPFDRPTHLPAE